MQTHHPTRHGRDDERGHPARGGLTMRLRMAGYDVVTASDASRHAETAISEQPDVIILDIGLPARRRSCRGQPDPAALKTMSIPIIYLTAAPPAPTSVRHRTSGGRLPGSAVRPRKNCSSRPGGADGPAGPRVA